MHFFIVFENLYDYIATLWLYIQRMEIDNLSNRQKPNIKAENSWRPYMRAFTDKSVSNGTQ